MQTECLSDNVAPPKKIVILGYGYELPVFTRARALWDFYLSHYPELTYFVCRSTNDLAYGEVTYNGHDLLFGTDPKTRLREGGSLGYSKTGIWSSTENLAQITTQLSLYDFLRRRFTENFLVAHCTVTSVVDFQGLMAVLDVLPARGCFAGMPGRISSPGTYEGLSFICGTNSVFSRDITELLTARFDPDSPHNAIPQDVNISWMLKDVARIPLPFFSFTKPRSALTDLAGVSKMTKRMLESGHYQFRVKTTSEQAGFGLRADVDPWIMFEIMRTILSLKSYPRASVDLKARLLRSLETASGTSMAAYEKNFFSGPRNFALTDEEAESAFPELHEQR